MKWYFNQETESEAGRLRISWVVEWEVGWGMWFGVEVVNKQLWKTAETSGRRVYLTCSEKRLTAMKRKKRTLSKEKVQRYLLHGLNSGQSIKWTMANAASTSVATRNLEKNLGTAGPQIMFYSTLFCYDFGGMP